MRCHLVKDSQSTRQSWHMQDTAVVLTHNSHLLTAVLLSLQLPLLQYPAGCCQWLTECCLSITQARGHHMQVCSRQCDELCKAACLVDDAQHLPDSSTQVADKQQQVANRLQHAPAHLAVQLAEADTAQSSVGIPCTCTGPPGGLAAAHNQDHIGSGIGERTHRQMQCNTQTSASHQEPTVLALPGYVQLDAPRCSGCSPPQTVPYTVCNQPGRCMVSLEDGISAAEASAVYVDLSHHPLAH